MEIFITTSMESTKVASIVQSMCDAESYALANRFTHLLNVEMDKVMPDGLLEKGLKHDKDVLLFNDHGAPWSGEKGLKRMDYDSLIPVGSGWGLMLVKVDVLRKASFTSGLRGGYITPDRLWFKRLLHLGVEVWRDCDQHATTTEPPSPVALPPTT
jgi:hypothetical protein